MSGRSCALSVQKIIFIVINSFVMLMGIICAIFGIILAVNAHLLGFSTVLLKIPAFFIVFGSFAVITGIVGCLGVSMNSMSILRTYAKCVFVLVIVQVIVSAVILNYRQRLSELSAEYFYKTISAAQKAGHFNRTNEVLRFQQSDQVTGIMPVYIAADVDISAYSRINKTSSILAYIVPFVIVVMVLAILEMGAVVAVCFL